jgi:hypothetical protein
MESIRAGGLNFMLNHESEGLLVYMLDTADPIKEHGFEVLRVAGQEINRKPFILSNAPLSKGEFIVTNGLKISVVESGDFGDVVKVEKI